MASARQQLMMLLGVPPSQKPSPERLLDMAKRQLVRTPDDNDLESLTTAYRIETTNKRARTASAAEASEVRSRCKWEPSDTEPAAESGEPLDEKLRLSLLQEALNVFDVGPSTRLAVVHGVRTPDLDADEVKFLAEVLLRRALAYAALAQELDGLVR